MKKMKRVLCLVLSVLLCLSLCGCQALDDMKAQHALRQADGSIVWNDTVYKPLPDIHADANTIYFVDTVRVTDPDVPVLLSEQYGELFDRDKECNYLYGCIQIDEYDYNPCLYCRADLYDVVAKRLEEGFVSKGYCYDYYVYEEGRMKTYYLTVEQEYAVNHVLTTVVPTSYEDSVWNYQTEISTYNEGDLHRQYAFDITSDGADFYIVYHDLIYAVPYDYTLIFEEIMRAEYQAEGKWGIEW